MNKQAVGIGLMFLKRYVFGISSYCIYCIVMGKHRQKASTKITFGFVILCFVLGAIIGTIGDFCHVFTEVDAYPANGPAPFLPLLPVLMPVWVPFLFGGALMMMGIVHRLLANTYRPAMGNNPDIAYAMPFLFTMLYGLTGFINLGTGGLQDVWIAAVAVLLWFAVDRSMIGAILALGNAIAGTMFEIMLVHAGGFYYLPEHANLMGVPSWLPWLYMSASICISLFVRQLK